MITKKELLELVYKQERVHNILVKDYNFLLDKVSTQAGEIERLRELLLERDNERKTS